MFCSKCGTEINEEHKFCPKCGSVISNIVSNKEDKKTSKVKFIIGIILICISLGFILFFLFAYHSLVDDGLLPSSLFFIFLFLLGSIFVATNCKMKNKSFQKYSNDIYNEELTNKTLINESENISDSKPAVMNIVLNVFWAIFGGLIYAFGWLIIGTLWCITIIGIPVGKQCFKFAKLTLAPFGKDIVYGGNTAKVIVNIIWLIFTGLWSAIAYAATGLALCISLIGIPLGLQYFKLAKLMLMPFGATIVDEK